MLLRRLAAFFFVGFPLAVAAIGFIFGAVQAAAESWSLSDGFLYVQSPPRVRQSATFFFAFGVCINLPVL